MLEVVPNHFKTQKMCDKAVDCIPWSLAHVPNYFKTQEMCNKAVYKNPCCLKYLPDYLKAGVMCNKEVVKSIRWYLERPSPPQYLQYLLGQVPDWFVTQQQLKIWHDNDDYCNDDGLIKWHDGYQKRKAQKARIKEELMPIAWHPDCVMDWCMSEDEKRSWK